METSKTLKISERIVHSSSFFQKVSSNELYTDFYFYVSSAKTLIYRIYHWARKQSMPFYQLLNAHHSPLSKPINVKISLASK